MVPKGIQTGPFAAYFTHFVPKNVHLSPKPHMINQVLLPKKEDGRKEQGLKIGKRESPKSESDTGVSEFGAYKLDHL